MQTQILQILHQIRSDADYANSGNFVDDGLLDSFDMVMLTSELEKNFHVSIDGLDFVPENFVSIQAIHALLLRSGAPL
jgi:acyl carrier protein